MRKRQDDDDDMMHKVEVGVVEKEGRVGGIFSCNG